MSIPDVTAVLRKGATRRATFRVSMRRSVHGISLVEQIVFIVIVGVGVAGMLAAMTIGTRGSADPMIQKQALAIAEAFLEEAQLMPFTYCDPDDAQARTATSATVGAGGCQATVEAIGPEGGETRYGTVTPFDNVSDYHGYDSNAEAPPGVKNIIGTAQPALAAYRAQISVANQALAAISATDSLLITVTVTGPGNTIVTAQGYRTRHAPNATP